MPEIIIKPDTSWNLECIRERFEVPADAVPSPTDTPEQAAFKALFIEACAKKAGERAIEYYEKFRHWRFRDDIPVELDESEIQVDVEDYEFASPLSTAPIAVNQGHLTLKTSKHAYVIKLWFETQQIQAVVFKPDNEEEEIKGVFGHKEGLAAADEVWKDYKTEEELNRG